MSEDRKKRFSSRVGTFMTPSVQDARELANPRGSTPSFVHRVEVFGVKAKFMDSPNLEDAAKAGAVGGAGGAAVGAGYAVLGDLSVGKWALGGGLLGFGLGAIIFGLIESVEID